MSQMAGKVVRSKRKFFPFLRSQWIDAALVFTSTLVLVVSCYISRPPICGVFIFGKTSITLSKFGNTIVALEQ